MDSSLSLNAQQELQKQKQEQAQKEELKSSLSHSPEMVTETDSKAYGLRMQQLSGGIMGFIDIFRSEWENKNVKVANSVIDMGLDVFRQDTEVGLYSSYSLQTFATGYENRKFDEKRSGPATDLMDSLNEWNELTKDKAKMANPAECLEKLFELSQAAGNYVFTHDKERFWSRAGAGRQKVAKKVRNMTSVCLDNLLTDKEKEAIRSNENADYGDGESDKTIEKDLKRAAKAYSRYRLQIARECQGYMPGGEMLEKKLRALLLNERKIKLYRQKYPKEEDRDPAIREMIREYEECLAWKTLRSVTRQKEEGFTELINQHMEKEGEEEFADKDKIVPADEKEELSPEQLKGINDIDNWLLRNFENGGVIGSLFSSAKNDDGELVTRILSLSKRERLHMYYLVEKGKRRNSSIIDVGISQTYAPNLSAFKDEMVATRLKFWKRAVGEYTYMNKLSDAFHVTMNYRKEIKAMTEVERDQKKQENTVENPKEKEAKKDPIAKRLSKLVELKGALEAFRSDLKKAKKAKGKTEKAQADALCAETRSYCKQLIKEVRELESTAEREKVYISEKKRMEDEVNEDLSNYSFLTKLPNDLDSTLLEGSFGTGTDGLVALLGAVTSTITLFKIGSQLTDEERAEKSLEITKSLYTAAQLGLTVAGKFVQNAAVVQSATVMTGAASAFGVAISAGMAVSQAVTASRMKTYGTKAGDYFKKKREKLEKGGEDQLSKKQKRELKYEKNMVKLQKELAERQKTKAVYNGVAAGLSTVGLVIPAIGAIAGIVSIVGSIHDFVNSYQLKFKLFDTFFNMDALVEKAVEQRYKDRRFNFNNLADSPIEKVKESLRKRVAAHAGFNNMKTAADYVCSKYARQIREKLFSKDTKDEERVGYINFVKALNLRYNREKGLPGEQILVRKLTAS